MYKMGHKCVIGLTGGIASGKSVTGKIFTSLGVTVIDADQLARDVVVPDSPGLLAVAERFGADYLTAAGEMDRVKLGALIFKDPAARATLDGLLHPRIHLLFQERCAAAQDTDTPYILYEAALLVELGLHEKLDRLVVVAATQELQIKRVMKRNGISEEDARSRVNSQFPLGRKLEVANYVIFNDNDRDALQIRTQDVHAQIMDYVDGRDPVGF